MRYIAAIVVAISALGLAQHATGQTIGAYYSARLQGGQRLIPAMGPGLRAQSGKLVLSFDYLTGSKRVTDVPLVASLGLSYTPRR